MDSESAELHELRARIEKLEKRGAKWKLWLGIPLIILFAIDTVANLQQIGIGSTSIATRNLVIKDEHGKDRAYFNADDQGTGLVLLGSDGKVLTGLTATDRYIGLSLSDRDGTNHIMLGLNSDSSAYLAMNGRYGSHTPRFFLLLGDSSRMRLTDANDSLLFHVP